MAGAEQIKPNPKLIAIVGGSGAGKTWLAQRLQKILGQNASHFSLDNFYRDRSHLNPTARSEINFDHPSAIDWHELEKVLWNCRKGRKTLLPQYDFATHTRKTLGVNFAPAALVLVDGLWLLRRPALRRLFDCTIFLDCPVNVRLERRLRRDRTERGRCPTSVQQQFSKTVAPMHDRFVEPQRHWADIVFTRSPALPEIRQLAKKLKTLLQEK